MATKEELQGKVLAELQQIAGSMGLTGTKAMRKADLIGAIVDRSNGGRAPAKERPAPTPVDNGGAPASASTEQAPAPEPQR